MNEPPEGPTGADSAPKFVEHSWSPIMRLGLLLVARALDAKDGSDFWVVGSAAMLGQGFAITARHVIGACMQRFGVRMTESGVMEGNYSIMAVQMWCDNDDPNPEAVLYDVRMMKTPPFGDLALLWLVRRTDLPTRYDDRLGRFSLVPPKIGDQAIAFGYHSGRVEMDLATNSITTIRQPATSIGNVIDLHLDGRPLVPGPSFMTNARYEGGMSGGPVLIDGVVYGLVTSCTKDAEGNAVYATASMLAPLMAIEVDCKLPDEAVGKNRTLHELARGGWLHIEGWERVEVLRDTAGTPIDVKYATPAVVGA